MHRNTAPAKPDPSAPWVIDTRDMGRRAGAMRRYHREVELPAGLGMPVIGIPAGEHLVLDVRLDLVTDRLEVELIELFAYPETATDGTTDPDEVSRVVDDLVDLEPVVRDAVLLALPQAPLCQEDCLGLCPECGGKRAELGADHRHEIIDPRWAALKQRLRGTEEENE
jgi:uncharacterized protein